MGAIIADRQARFLEKIAKPDEMIDEMVQRMCGIEGHYEGLPAICRAWDVPYGRVMTWLIADVERYAVYQRALEVQAHALVSETVGIADDTVNDVARDKLRVETRFRVAKHHAAKVYGDKVDVNHNVVPVFSVVINAGGAQPVAEQPQVIEGDVL